MYQGRTAAEAGLVFGHENMGIVDELGSGVSLLKKGDRVVIPFNVADGRVSLQFSVHWSHLCVTGIPMLEVCTS